MGKRSRVREQHIAVFGGSGSGKTVLLSSFFGPTQERAFRNDLWDLVADHTGDGHRLYQNYLGMRDSATTPASTRLRGHSYRFTMKLKGGESEAAKKRPFDALRLVWHDYPGDWFEQEPDSEREMQRRTKTFKDLMRSDVAFLLVDGQRLVEYAGEEERYLKLLFTNFRQGLLRLHDDILEDGNRLTEFPRIWMIAMSKADLLPGWDVSTFRDLVIAKAAGELADLRETLGMFVEVPDAMSVGEDFILLSSAKFELADDYVPVAIDVTTRVGLDLILPVASILPMERRAQWEQRLEIPRKVLDTIADNSEVIAGVMLAMNKKVLRKVSQLPGWGKAIAILALSVPEAARLTGEKLREVNAQARAKNDHLAAALTQFKIDLETAEADGVLLTSRK